MHLGSYCDYFVMHRDAGSLWTGKHVGYSACGSSYTIDPCVQAKEKKKGQHVICADPGDSPVGPSPVIYDFSHPFGSKGTWAIIGCSGGTCFVLNSGQQDAKSPQTPNKGTSALSAAIRALHEAK